MHVPVSWLRDFIETDARPDAIGDALTGRGFTVDSVDEQPMPERIVVGKIESLGPVPGADKLRVGTVDVGREKLQIVTGAANVAAGQKVPIAMVGAVVFARRTADGVRETKLIGKAKLRGMDSAGMMCSPEELALPGDFDDGILILDDDAPVGADFWKAVRFGDAVLDVDVPSNRADCLSIIGLAREAAAGLGAVFREPSPDAFAGALPSPIGVAIGDAAVCRRLLGQCFFGLANRRAPVWMTLRLHAARVRSLNFLVDVSNYVQIETGQPLHFYDARRLRGGKIEARAAKAGESVVTLDGVERKLAEGMPVIADGDRVIGVAGIMGGVEASIGDDTHDVFLESPNFVGRSIRRASIALGLRTEGAIRHERNLPLRLPEFGRRRAAELLVGAGASPSAVVEAGDAPPVPRSFDVRPERVNALLGTDYPPAKMRTAIEPIGIAAHGESPMRVTIPWWRTDLVEEVDIAEEIARSIGFADIAPRRSPTAPQAVDESEFRQDRILAQACVVAGYREIVSIAIAGSRAVAAWERSGLSFWDGLVAVQNPLSDEQRFMRPSLLPGLLTAAAKAWPRSAGSLRLFETGHVFRTRESEREEASTQTAELPAVLEWPSLGGLAVFAAQDESGGIDRHLLAVKGDVEYLLGRFDSERAAVVAHQRPYLHPRAAANLESRGKTLAKFGRLHPRLARAYELPPASYVFLLYLENLPAVRPVVRFEALPKYPGTRRDIAVVVDEDVTAGELTQSARDAGAAAVYDVFAFDEYAGPQVGPGKKSVALGILLRLEDATITDAQADASADQITQRLRRDFGATLRGPA